MSDYMVMDGRANFDVDRAMVVVAGVTYEKGKAIVDNGDFGGDCCLVDENWKVVYSATSNTQVEE